MVRGNKKTILIAEDEFINRAMLAQILSDEYVVLEAEDGKTALQLIEDNKDELSLILLDLLMPELSGLELLAHIQSDPSLNNIPVMVLTSEKGQEVECLSLGACDFISKPYPDPAIIKARVRRVVELFENKKTINSTERDTLTKLYTKEYFYKYTEDFDKHNKEMNMDAMVIGIRSFHIIKERFGPKQSDSLLVKFAKRLKAAIANMSGMVCHLEADAFIIYIEHLEDYESFLKEVSNDFFADKEKKTPIKLQMGVYQNVDKGIDIDMRFERAKIALNKIKDNVVKSVSLYDHQLQEKEMFKEELLEEFPRAIKEKQFVVYYQPKYNIQGDEPRLSSAEALIRWNHPEKGLISPGIFIPLFEEKGLIQLLDLYVWEEAAAQIKKWKDEFDKFVPISVNVSRIDLFDPNLVNTLNNIVERNGINHSELLLEITESACIEEADSIIKKIEDLRQAGFKIEIDDFGTGYSSLSMINKIPFDALKIDMIFIRNAFRSQNDNQMIKIIIDIASYLKVPTIAEGVETIEQVQVLKQLGCDLVQGYYFSKPVPIDEFNKFLLK